MLHKEPEDGALRGYMLGSIELQSVTPYTVRRFSEINFSDSGGDKERYHRGQWFPFLYNGIAKISADFFG